MELYRLTRDLHGKVLSGKGASISGGRWNSPGTEIIYTAANRSLAMAEVAVHFSIATLPAGYMMMTLTLPDSLSVSVTEPDTLPAGWNQYPPLKETQQYGDQFIKDGKTCLLKVPSAVTQGDFNFLINPGHPEFRQIKISGYDPFPFDRRLFKT